MYLFKMKKIILLTILVILIKIIQTSKIHELNQADRQDDDTITADTFNYLNKKMFNKIFHHIEFVTISVENRNLFSKILQLTSSKKSYFIINNKYCFNSIINVHTNYFLNSYTENADAIFGHRKHSVALNKTLTYHSVVNLNDKNYGGFVFEITSLNIFAYIINCYVTPAGTYLFIINNNSKASNKHGNTSDYVYDDYFLQDDIIENDITLNDIETLFNEIWINYQNYKIFIYLNGQIITYNPFHYNVTLHRYGKLILNTSDDSVNDDGEFLSEINLKQLNEYPLKIEIFPSTYVLQVMDEGARNKHFVGVDMEVSKTLQRFMNYTAIKIKPDGFQFGFRLPNGSFTGSIGNLIRHSSDIAVNGFFIKDYLTRDIEFTTGVYSDQLCLILRKADRIPSSLLPLLCFKGDLWGMILLVLIGSSIFWCVIRRINDTTYFKRIYESNCKWPDNMDRFNRSMWILEHKPFQYYQIFVDTMLLMGTAPLRRFTKVTTERCFIFTLCLISLIFGSIFQSKLATVFIEPVYYKDVMNLNEMETSRLKIAIRYPAMKDDLFPTNSTKLFENLRNQLVLVDPKKTQATGDKYWERKLATVTRLSKLKLSDSIYVTNRTFWIVPECPKTYMLAYVVAKDSVYLEPINEILLRLGNGGFINKWINDMYYNQTWSDIRTYGIFYVVKLKTLTVSDLQLAFMILVLGILISTALFMIELNIKTCFKLFRKLNKTF